MGLTLLGASMAVGCTVEGEGDDPADMIIVDEDPSEERRVDTEQGGDAGQG